MTAGPTSMMAIFAIQEKLAMSDAMRIAHVGNGGGADAASSGAYVSSRLPRRPTSPASIALMRFICPMRHHHDVFRPDVAKHRRLAKY